nr:trypsin-like peptidase domain-containing protein [Mycolicibacterium malmesburyense]CRL68221.1 serine protease PepA [Mycolicibacterium malmesburyense]
MSEAGRTLLGQLSDEIAALAAGVMPRTATVTGQTRQLEEHSGTAWLYDAKHLLTNDHVVADLVDPIVVELPQRQVFSALVVGRDPMTDIAVLRIEPQSIAPLQLCDRPARLGELCFAFGSPLGEYQESISIGIVSGLGRSMPTAEQPIVFDVIQTDAAINPGNSGGPLVDTTGRVLGMTSEAIPGADGMGFAIPAGTVHDIATELLTHGTVQRASLGISVAVRTVEKLPAGEGVVVTRLGDNVAGPLECGDVLLTIGGRPISSKQDVLSALRRDAANRKVEVRVWREGREVTIECLPRPRSTDDRR